MKTSTDRTLTPMSAACPGLAGRFYDREDHGKSFDETAFEAALTAAVKDVVQRQKISASTSSRTENSASGASRCMRTNGSGASNRRGARGHHLGKSHGIGFLSRILRKRSGRQGPQTDAKLHADELHRPNHLQGPKAARPRSRKSPGSLRCRRRGGSLHAGNFTFGCGRQSTKRILRH